jgi:hypothetical protein
MKLQIMSKLFDRMALVVKASVDTGQDGVKFAACRVRLFGVGLTSEVLEAAKIKSFHPLLNMSYQVYKTNSADWYLITIDQTGLEAARNDVGKHCGPFCLWKTIDSLGVMGMDEEATVSRNLEAYGYHMQNSKIEFTEQPC